MSKKFTPVPDGRRCSTLSQISVRICSSAGSQVSPGHGLRRRGDRRLRGRLPLRRPWSGYAAEFRNPCLRPRDHVCQQADVAVQQAADLPGRENPGPILGVYPGAARRLLDHVDTEVEPSGYGFDDVGHCRQRAKAFHRRRCRNRGEKDLENRIPADGPGRLQRLHQVFESRSVLIVQGLKDCFPCPGQQIPESGISGEVRADHHDIGERANHVLDFDPVAARRRTPRTWSCCPERCQSRTVKAASDKANDVVQCRSAVDFIADISSGDIRTARLAPSVDGSAPGSTATGRACGAGAPTSRRAQWAR